MARGVLDGVSWSIPLIRTLTEGRLGDYQDCRRTSGYASMIGNS
jgi:hypothetical protein